MRNGNSIKRARAAARASEARRNYNKKQGKRIARALASASGS